MWKYDINSSLEIKQEGKKYIILWQHPLTGEFRKCEAEPYQLLALKIVSDDLDIKELSVEEGVHPQYFYKILLAAERDGLLIKKESLIKRGDTVFENAWFPSDIYKVADVFVLQWHITNRCNYSCLHCYNDLSVPELTLDQAFYILDSFYDFCNLMGVHGQISFTGGNPFLYPYFFDVYYKAFTLGFSLAILGNPVEEDELKKVG